MLLSLAPAFATLTSGARRAAVVGLIAIAVCVALSHYDRLIGTAESNLSLLSVAGVTLAAALATVGRQRRERELTDVRSVAEVAQRVMLRPVLRFVGHLHAAVSYTSAFAEARIGGDLYELVASPWGVRVIVGDVRGKRREAVETAALVLDAFREAAPDERHLQTVGARRPSGVTSSTTSTPRSTTTRRSCCSVPVTRAPPVTHR